MSETRHGSCLCGAVRFTARGPVRGVVYCHCTQCRKQTGHYYAATNVSDDALTIEGGDAVHWYRASSTASRGFCASRPRSNLPNTLKLHGWRVNHIA